MIWEVSIKGVQMRVQEMAVTVNIAFSYDARTHEQERPG